MEASSKRTQKEMNLADLGRGHKRQRVTADSEFVTLPNPVTKAIFDSFCSRRRLGLTQKHFVALCAYLCAILRWGYPLRCCNFDDFIEAAPTFWAWLPTLEDDLKHEVSPKIVSYHQWLLEQLPSRPPLECHGGSAGCASLLTEQGLRSIWRENPYVFLRTEITLEAKIAQVRPPQLEDHRDTVPETAPAGGGEGTSATSFKNLDKTTDEAGHQKSAV